MIKGIGFVTLGRLDYIGVATYTMDDTSLVIASGARQSRLFDVVLDCRVASLLAKTTEGAVP